MGIPTFKENSNTQRAVNLKLLSIISKTSFFQITRISKLAWALSQSANSMERSPPNGESSPGRKGCRSKTTLTSSWENGQLWPSRTERLTGSDMATQYTLHTGQSVEKCSWFVKKPAIDLLSRQIFM